MRMLEDCLAERMLAGEIKEGDTAIMDVDSDGRVTVLNGSGQTFAGSVRARASSRASRVAQLINLLLTRRLWNVAGDL
jgi:hypothetical protein